MKTFSNDKLIDIVKMASEKKPLILNLLNIVSVNDVVNAQLAVNASPIAGIRYEPEDVNDLLKISSAIYVNIGTFNNADIKLVHDIVKQTVNLPSVLDIVACGASNFRLKVSNQLLPFISIIKGNAAEMQSLYANQLLTKGVDSTIDLNNPSKLAVALAKKYQKTFVITGKTDYVSDENNCYSLSYGHSNLQTITGTGCIVGGLITVFSAVCSSQVDAAIVALYLFSLASELASANAQGPYSFRVNLLDKLALLCREPSKYLVNDIIITPYV